MSHKKCLTMTTKLPLCEALRILHELESVTITAPVASIRASEGITTRTPKPLKKSSSADDSRSEQSGTSQHSPSLDDWSPNNHGDNFYNQDAYPNGQSNTSQYPSRKRKYSSEYRRDLKRPHFEAELGSSSGPSELRPLPHRDERGPHASLNRGLTPELARLYMARRWLSDPPLPGQLGSTRIPAETQRSRLVQQDAVWLGKTWMQLMLLVSKLDGHSSFQFELLKRSV
ncbi:hypothetical protein BDZ45DRAFT_685588 [Acephala macrosclerotiorum]|nr:hypothetical protein BDZ45DRAFT_685588 [Acephala macrosclerotiorum]